VSGPDDDAKRALGHPCHCSPHGTALQPPTTAPADGMPPHAAETQEWIAFCTSRDGRMSWPSRAALAYS
jgi:hypothetical protein